MGNNQFLQVGAEALAGVVGGMAAAAFIELPFVLFGAAALLGVCRLWRTQSMKPTAAGRTMVVPGSSPTASPQACPRRWPTSSTHRPLGRE